MGLQCGKKRGDDKMKLKEIEFLMVMGMISVEDDNINYVIDALKSNGFKVD